MSAPSTSQSHAALIWFIRGTGALFSLFFGIGTLGLVVLFVFGQYHRNTIHGSVFTMIMIISIGLMVLVNGLFAKAGYDMFRQVDAAAIDNVAFIYAAIFARALYYLLPHILPKTTYSSIGDAVISHHGLVAFIVFLILWRLIKSRLMSILDLDPVGAPRQLPPTDVPPDSDIPEYPKKSPLVGL